MQFGPFFLMTAEIRGPFLERVDDDAPDNRRHVPLRSKMKENKRGIFILFFGLFQASDSMQFLSTMSSSQPRRKKGSQYLDRH
jgi:hypothetical protein